jgi:hypothetical protein
MQLKEENVWTLSTIAWNIQRLLDQVVNDHK